MVMSSSKLFKVLALILGMMLIGKGLLYYPNLQRNLINISLIKSLLGFGNQTSYLFSRAGVSSNVQARALAQLEPAQAEFWLQQGTGDNGRSLTTFELCRLYWQEGHMEEAVAACQAGDIQAIYWVNLGLKAEQNRDYDLALTAYETAAAVDGQSAAAWFRLGHIHSVIQNHAAVIPAHQQALASGYPPQSSIYEEIGRAHLQLGNLAVARETFTEGLRLFPDSRPLHFDMVTLSRQESDWQTADIWLARLLEKWPEDAHAWAIRGEIAWQQDDFTKALTYYKQSVHYRPDVTGYWSGVAQSAVQLEDLSQAAAAYEQIMALAPTQPSLWLQAGEFFLENHRPQKAAEAFAQVLILEPTNEQAQERLANLTQHE
jgi:tetratricopeptide (TPR) repeat protein